MATNFTKCAVCSNPSLLRLCSTCESIAPTFEALNNPTPLQKLIRRLPHSELVSAFYYLRRAQITRLEALTALSKHRGVEVSKSKLMRLALQIGLMVIESLSFDELRMITEDLEEKS